MFVTMMVVGISSACIHQRQQLTSIVHAATITTKKRKLAPGKKTKTAKRSRDHEFINQREYEPTSAIDNAKTDGQK